jgi:phospholipase/carboxylesterase
MLDVAARLRLDDVAYVLPVAAGRSWYPGPYFDPVAGFSQGACLIAELVARRARPGGAAVLTGTLLGLAGQRTAPDGVAGRMFLCASRHDDWIEFDDARATARAFGVAGALVTFEAYDDHGHHISDRAIDGLRRLLIS